MKKIGIFGGSFDPIHVGHIKYAGFMCDKFALDKLMVIPAKVSPFKKENRVSDSDRLNMCRLAFDDERITVSDIEISRGGVSYTVDTVAEIKRLYPSYEIYLFVGADQFMSFDRWRSFDEILQNAVLVGVSRDGTVSRREMEAFGEKRLRRYGRVIVTDFVPFEISSTEIRGRLKRGEPIHGLVPEKTEQYIIDGGLYRDL